MRSFLDFDPVGVGSASVVVNASRSVAHANRVGTFRLTSSMRFSGHIDESCIKNRGTHTVPTRVDRGGDLSQSIVCVYSMNFCVDTTVQFLVGGSRKEWWALSGVRMCMCIQCNECVDRHRRFAFAHSFAHLIKLASVNSRLPKKPGAVGGSVVF